MIARKPMRFAAFLLIVVALWTTNVGCAVPADWVALIGISWFKDLVIGDKIRIEVNPQDGCYQNGQPVDCTTM